MPVELLERAKRWRFHANQLRATATSLEGQKKIDLNKLADQWEAVAAKFEAQAREKQAGDSVSP